MIRSEDFVPGRFFGPCAGTRDLPVAFQNAGSALNWFTFCDLSYKKGVSVEGAVPGTWKLVSRDISSRESRRTTWYNCHRAFTRFVTREIWRRPDGSEVVVELHCDLAQDVLLQFAPGSISAFMHINDSEGEGGSDLWFLGEPKGQALKSDRGQRLLPDLVLRLAPGAIVITDGLLAEKGFRGKNEFVCQNMRWKLMQRVANSYSGHGPVSFWQARHR